MEDDDFVASAVPVAVPMRNEMTAVMNLLVIVMSSESGSVNLSVVLLFAENVSLSISSGKRVPKKSVAFFIYFLIAHSGT